MTAMPPTLSVIVRLADDPDAAARVFDALAMSELARPQWELIVVTPGRPDTAIDIAAQRADVIVRLDRPWADGSAYVCNRGAEVARAPVLVFLEGHVLVRPDTLERIARAFTDEQLAAVVAGIDPAPRSADLVTRCATLLHDAAHRRCLGESEHFTTCAGAIRRRVFFACGELDEWPSSPQACAGADLGLRLRALGHRVDVRDDIRVAHNGPISWKEAAQPCALQQLPPPWLRLLASKAATTATGRFREREQWMSRWAWLAAAGIVIGVGVRSAKTALLAVTIAAVGFLVDAPLMLRMVRNGGVTVAALALVLRMSMLLIQGGRSLANRIRVRVIGEPRPAPGIEALGEVGVQRWPPAPSRAHPVLARETAQPPGRGG